MFRWHSFVQSSVAEVEAELDARGPEAEVDGLTLVEMLLLDPELSREDAHAYLMDLLTAGIDAVGTKCENAVIRSTCVVLVSPLGKVALAT